MSDLFDRKLLVIAGKGGVGKTTVAAALAVAASRRGKRVLIAQTDAVERLSKMFGRREAIGSNVVTVAPAIDAVNMTPKSALHEYGLMVLRYETVYRALFENRAVRGFLSAIPGLDAYAMLGKTWWHTTELQNGRPRYDLVILDGPATGHAVLMLRIPQAILDTLPKGPLTNDAAAARELLSDPARAALVIVTLPEELPVREAIELAHTARTSLQVPLGPLVVNALPSDALLDATVRATLNQVLPPTGDDALDATLRLGTSVRAHRQTAEQMLTRLRDNPGLPLLTLPRLPTIDLGPADLGLLAERFTD
ncbi:MAG TPA: ArsA family ATPase [Polyangia bacterium]|jgi:anion-transporting  ArsA/GET3 family ATPase|nr:ArsA family ATPase [Polyangia bacterium]